jgi:hypothetical protein
MRNRRESQNHSFSRRITDNSTGNRILNELWSQALRRYADVWSGAVLQDGFKVYVYPSADSDFLREIDFASEEPEISKRIGETLGVQPNPDDLLISLGSRMGSRNEPNDPEAWAAIDAGEYVCFTHFGMADRTMGWEQKYLLLAAASTVVLMAHPQGRLMTYVDTDGTSDEITNVPKVDLLSNYLLSSAAAECYRDDGPKQNPKVLLARLCEEHEITWNIVEAVGSIAMAKPAEWFRGPLPTIEIARKAGELLAEACSHVVVPNITPARQSARTTEPPPATRRPAA